MERELGAPPSALVLAISSTTLTPGTPAFEVAAHAAVDGVANAPHVVAVRSHLIAPTQVDVEKGIVYDVVLLDLKPDDSPAALDGIQAALVEVEGITVAIAGGPSFYADIQRVSETDLQRSELISLPLAGIVLLLVFGSAVAAGLPLAVGGATVIVALAAIFGVANATRMSIFVLNLTTLLGLGLGVDYSLLMVSRFRELGIHRDKTTWSKILRGRWKRDARGDVSLTRFYVRRTLRIMPVYYGLLATAQAVGSLIVSVVMVCVEKIRNRSPSTGYSGVLIVSVESVPAGVIWRTDTQFPEVAYCGLQPTEPPTVKVWPEVGTDFV